MPNVAAIKTHWVDASHKSAPKAPMIDRMMATMDKPTKTLLGAFIFPPRFTPLNSFYLTGFIYLDFSIDEQKKLKAEAVLLTKNPLLQLPKKSVCKHQISSS
jgi:hypothetical protein